MAFRNDKTTDRGFEIRCGQKFRPGNFGDVFECDGYSDSESCEVAIKILGNKVGYGVNPHLILANEKMIMEKLDHPNIVKLVDTVRTIPTPWIITEYTVKGCLLGVLKQPLNISELKDLRIAKILRDIASGMEHVASKNIVHRDLAARNILVDDQFCCKIFDFGLSRLEEQDQQYSNPSPPDWAAPEVISYGIYTQDSDVWDFGYVIWEILTFGDSPNETVEIIKSHRLGSLRSSPRILVELMLACWEERPTFEKLRIKLDEILQYPSMLQDTFG